MLLKHIFLSIPRSTLETLVKYRIIRANVLLWYDLIRFFDSLDLSEEAHRRRLSQMEKYLIAADRHGMSDEQARKIISRLNTPI